MIKLPFKSLALPSQDEKRREEEGRGRRGGVKPRGLKNVRYKLSL